MWNVIVARRAQRDFRKVSKSDFERIKTALLAMKENLFTGDAKALRGEYGGSFRRRVGSWRIFFGVDFKSKTVSVTGILRRSSTTY